MVAGVGVPAARSASGRVPARAEAMSTAARWAEVVYCIALLLVWFQGDVVERMAARLLPLAALTVVLTCRRRDLLGRILPLPLAGFLAWAMASYLWSPDRGDSAIVLLGFVSSVIVAWCCGSFLSLSDLHRLTTAVVKVLCLVTVTMLLLAHGAATRPAEDGAPGWHGPFSHKNGLGAFMVVALLCFWFDHRSTRHQRLGWLGLGVVLLIGSQSSTALVLVLLAAAVVAWHRSSCRRRSVWRGVGQLGTLLAVVAGVGLLLVTRFDLLAGLLGRNGSLSGRTNIWAVVVERIAEKPIAGWGFGGMWRPASVPSQRMWVEMRFHAYHAHSGYLDLLLQVGAIGLALYLAFVAGTLRRHWRARNRSLHLWAVLIVLTVCLNAVTESAPFFSDGLLFLVAFAVVPKQTLVPLQQPRRLNGGTT
jgi:exopolysaccharide production protein ExoQ